MSHWQASFLVSTLEAIWERIQTLHPSLPTAVVVVASGTEATSARRWGHWGVGRWKLAEGKFVGEVFIAGERIGGEHGGPEQTLSTLLHEAAHALAFAGKIRDTSRGGRYHNEKYKALAESVGLTVTQGPQYGWHVTELARGTAQIYEPELRALRRAIGEAHRLMAPEARAVIRVGGSSGGDDDQAGGDAGDGEKVRGKRSRLSCMCRKPRKISVAEGVAALGPIICGICGNVFRAAES